MMLDALSATQWAMQTDELKLQSINQNITNMHTPGFKRQVMENAAFTDYLQPSMNLAVDNLQKEQINTQGVLNQTHQPYDLAISGEGYFQVQGEQGIFYTRRGDFQVNQQGELTTATGETLLGNGGVIKIEDSNFVIDSQGRIVIDNHPVDQVNLVRFDHPRQLKSIGNGLYQSDETPQPVGSGVRLHQGFIEQSNVKSIDEMLEMVKTSRHFAASQTVLRTANNLLTTAIHQLGESNV